MKPSAETEPMHILEEFVCRAIMIPPYDRIQPKRGDSPPANSDGRGDGTPAAAGDAAPRDGQAD